MELAKGWWWALHSFSSKEFLPFSYFLKKPYFDYGEWIVMFTTMIVTCMELHCWNWASLTSNLRPQAHSCLLCNGVDMQSMHECSGGQVRLGALWMETRRTYKSDCPGTSKCPFGWSTLTQHRKQAFVPNTRMWVWVCTCDSILLRLNIMFSWLFDQENDSSKF